MDTIARAKPAAAKGTYIRSATISSTMGPGVQARDGGVPMNKTERQETVQSLTEQLRASPNLYVTDFSGLNVLRMTEFRRRLRAAGVTYVVVKNTLAQRALAANSVTGLDEHLAGPTGLVLAGRIRWPRPRCSPTSPRNSRSPRSRSDWWTAGRSRRTRSSGWPVCRPSRSCCPSWQVPCRLPWPSSPGSLNGILYQMVGALEALRAQRSARRRCHRDPNVRREKIDAHHHAE